MGKGLDILSQDFQEKTLDVFLKKSRLQLCDNGLQRCEVQTWVFETQIFFSVVPSGQAKTNG